MNSYDILAEHYSTHDEDQRFKSKHGKVEFITTMKYITAYTDPSFRIAEIGAGTGAYSIPLAQTGYSVTAVDLIQAHIDIIDGKSDALDLDIATYRADACNLNMLEDESQDATLLLGPMYHLYTKDDQIKALAEAVRVTKPCGYIFVAYCMADPTILNFLFKDGYVTDYAARGLVDSNGNFKNTPEEKFCLYRLNDINELNNCIPATRVKIIASDGRTGYIKQAVDEMPSEVYTRYMKYHLATCELPELLGSSYHTLDILRKDKT